MYSVTQDQITQVAAGDAHTLVLMASGRVFAFGQNTSGQCGVGVSGTKNISKPAAVRKVVHDLFIENAAPAFQSVACGSKHSLAVATDGTVYVAGSNEKGQIGLPGVETSDIFCRLETQSTVACAKVFAGGDHSFMLLEGYKKQKERWIEIEEEALTESEDKVSENSVVQYLAE